MTRKHKQPRQETTPTPLLIGKQTEEPIYMDPEVLISFLLVLKDHHQTILAQIQSDHPQVWQQIEQNSNPVYHHIENLLQLEWMPQELQQMVQRMKESIERGQLPTS